MGFYFTSSLTLKTGHDSMFHNGDRHRSSSNVTTVDLARVFREHTAPGDVVVMRLDVEGAEYELLRHLLVAGLLCRLSRLYLEVHAMAHSELHRFRVFDVMLPWLLEPCGVEVFVDSHYHSVFESRRQWPFSDGPCRLCPLLYAPFPGAGPDGGCPGTALPQCFGGGFTCDRCCNLDEGPRGDVECWSRGSEVATRLESGGRGHPFPREVLRRLGPGAEAVAGAPAGWPHLFSYELCCAGMVEQLLPGLLPIVARQGQNEAYSPADQRFHRAARAPAAPLGRSRNGLATAAE